MAAVPLGVFLLDDHEVVRTGLRALLEASGDIDVVGEAGTVADALARIPATKPDVAILDVRLPDGSGVEVCREIRSDSPRSPASCSRRTPTTRRSSRPIMAGAAGYVLKQVGSLDLVDTIRRAGAGQSLLDPALTERVLAPPARGTRGGPSPGQPHPAGAADPRPHRRRAARTARSPRRCSWPRRR